MSFLDDEDLRIEDFRIEDWDDDEEDAFHTVEEYEEWEREWHPENFEPERPERA